MLLRHNNNVEMAVEAILNGETSRQQKSSSETKSPKDHEPNHAHRDSDLELARISSLRHAIPEEDRRRQREKEEQDFEKALMASMDPSDRGRLVGYVDFAGDMSNSVISEMICNPAFNAKIDGDLRKAIEIQRQIDIDAEERSLAILNGETVVHPGSITPAINTDSVSCTGFKSIPNRKLSSSPTSRNPTNVPSSCQNGRKSLGASFQPLSPSRKMRSSVGRLNCMNRKNNEDTKSSVDSDRLTKEAVAACNEACMTVLKDHFENFVNANPKATYEKWIEDINPENAHEGLLLEGLGKTIDHRYYVDDSDHRRLWNEHLTTGSVSRAFVPVRNTHTTVVGNDSTNGTIDLLAEGNDNDSRKDEPKYRGTNAVGQSLPEAYPDKLIMFDN